MGDFIERSILAQICIVLFCVTAFWFFVVWFPYGFMAGDLTINPMLWSETRRVVLVFFWSISLVVMGLSASS